MKKPLLQPLKQDLKESRKKDIKIPQQLELLKHYKRKPKKDFVLFF
jgi:hypothetical protein